MTSAGKSLAWFLLPVLCAILQPACHRKPEVLPSRLEGEAQGTYFAITWFDSLHRDFSYQIDSLLKAVDLSVSVYTDTSLISRMNRNEDVVADQIFTDNFTKAWQISKASGGAFDCTIGRLIEAWGFGFSRRDSVTPELVDSLRAISGYRRVSLTDGKLLKEDPAITLNFNAIAQGYTSDLIARFLVSQGVNSFLVDVGGELVAHGTKPDGAPWSIGIELPDESNTIPEDLSSRPVRAIMSITGKGVATSGNYRKFYVENGVRYSHTIDPATGYPVKHSLLSATVVAGDAVTADAWATAFMVVGLEKSREFLKAHPGLQAYLIYSDENGKDRSWSSEGLKTAITEVAE